MYIEVRTYARAHPQRIADLSALLRYLYSVKDPAGLEDVEHEKNYLYRLVGPPVMSRLIQRISPYGKSINAAAYDIAQQIFNHARESPVKGNLPVEVYKHILVSFPIQELNRHFKESKRLAADPTRQLQSDFYIIIRIVRELLDAMGIGVSPPTIIVVHSNTKHHHAHVVVGMYARDLDCSNVFKSLNERVIKNIASNLYAGHEWKFPSEALELEYQKDIKLMSVCDLIRLLSHLKSFNERKNA